MKKQEKKELMDFLRSEIYSLEKAIRKATVRYQFSKVEYYEGMRDAYISGLNQLLTENQND